MKSGGIAHRATRVSIVLSALWLCVWAHAQTPIVNLTPASAVMVANGGPGQFKTPTLITANVNSTVKWRIRCFAEVTGPNGAIDPTSISLVPDTTFVSPPGSFYTPTTQTLGSLVTVAYGLPMTNQVARFQLVGNIPPLTKPGLVRGNVRVIVDNQNGGQLQAFVFSFVYTMQPYVTVQIGGSSMDFVAPSPGSHISNALPFTVTTNIAAGATVNLSLSQLFAGLNSIPKSQTALAYGNSAASAQTAALAAPFGQGSVSIFNFFHPYGSTTYYLAGKAQTTTINPPGVYSGSVTVTATGN